ncbi:hypothetical protein [Hydrogenophaga sp. 5NK40-0174]|uniref:hypothetical protein n=1 Tax=Hydrogenophaga sp. 5NK40-0174 TaxID=3127649 RepID=UPI00310C59FD
MIKWLKNSASKMSVVALASLSVVFAVHAADSSNALAAAVCKLRTGGGTIVAGVGFGCSWAEVDGSTLKRGEEVMLTILPKADAGMASYLGETLKKMHRNGQALKSSLDPVSVCSQGEPSGEVLTFEVPGTSVATLQGYAMCDGDLLHMRITLDRGDSSRAKLLPIFEDAMKKAVPLTSVY